MKERKRANNAVVEETNEKRQGDQTKETEKRDARRHEVSPGEWEISRHINIQPMFKTLQLGCMQFYSHGLMWDDRFGNWAMWYLHERQRRKTLDSDLGSTSQLVV